MNKRFLACVVFVVGAVVWTIAKGLTNGGLGAIPTLIILGPFLYGANRLWQSGAKPAAQIETEQRAATDKKLEDIAANPKVSDEKRAQATRLLEERRRATQTHVKPEAEITHVAQVNDLQSETRSEDTQNSRFRALGFLGAVIILAVAAGLYSKSRPSSSNPGSTPLTKTAFASSEEPARAVSTRNSSAFIRQEFAGVSLSVPKDWRSIGENDARSLNTNSEAMSEAVGAPARQGNNTILWAANAIDDGNVTRATMRLSVRADQAGGQREMREALAQPQEAIERELLNAAEEAAPAMRRLPQIKYYNVTGAGLRQNGNIVCVWNGSEYDAGKGPTVSDLWICPVSGRTIKFATSYDKSRAALYAATIDRTWNSLSVGPAS